MDVEPAAPRLGGHALAQVARRGRIWRPQQHHHKLRSIIQNQRQVVAFLGTFVCPAQQGWLLGNDLQDPATWDSPPLCQLKHLHQELLQHYD
jgi:hypothetical protein